MALISSAEIQPTNLLQRENQNLLSLPSNSKPSRPKQFFILSSNNLNSNNNNISLKRVIQHSPSATSSSAAPSSNGDPNSQLRRFCVHGDLDKAVSFFESVCGQTRLDEDAFISLVRLCEWKRATAEGSRVYSFIAGSMTQFSLCLGNTLLSMLVRFGNLFDAWSVFGRMVERDVFSWNVMISGYGKSGCLDDVLDLYYRMLWAGVGPDVYTFPCVLRCCGGLGDWVRGMEVHAHVYRFGLGSEIDVSNALITMYSKCGDIASACKVFKCMQVRDCVSWNAMIAGHVENGDCFRGLELFLMMLDLALEPDLMTMTSVISAIRMVGTMMTGREIHGYAMKSGFFVDVSVLNALVQMYISLGHLKEAEQVFSRTPSKDVVSWTAMISGYEKSGSPDRALELFEDMRDDGVLPDEVTLASVLAACACLGRLDVGSELHELARSSGFLPYRIIENTLLDMYSKSKCIDKALEIFKHMPEKDVVSWSSIISGCRINHKSIEALNLFRQMQAYVVPNTITFIVALSACAAIGALMCGKEIHAQALRRGLACDGFLPNAVLDMYVKCGRTKYALTQFNVYLEKDVVSWNIMLSGYAARGYGDLALELFHEMEEEGIKPDEVTFIALLCACSRSGMLDQGWEYFKTMSSKYFISPNLRHYACMVDLLGRAGQLKKAHEFIRDMPVKPDAAIWGALLNGCRIHHQVELGEIAARHIFELDSESAGYYVLLCNLYAEDGRWDQVARVRKAMRERGLTIDPGCSWVEAKGSVHAFLSGDESHPQIKEINAVLHGLYDRMKSIGLIPENGFSDPVEASKAEIFCGHSERLAVAFGLINTIPGTQIWVTKNLYMCSDCHNIMKAISKIVRREITVRDTEQFHQFKDGKCSCGDHGYWIEHDHYHSRVQFPG